MNSTMITKITYSFDFAPLFSKGTGVAKSGFIDHKSSGKINKNYNPYYSNLEFDHIHQVAGFASSVYLLDRNIVAQL